MFADDPRANILLETAGSYFGAPLKGATLDKASAEALGRFLNEPKCSSVAFCWSPPDQRLSCSEMVPALGEDASKLCVAFYKTKPVAFARENWQEVVSIVSVQVPTVAESLLGAVEKVFAPPILRKANPAQTDIAVQRLVSELQEDLTKTLNSSKRWSKDGTDGKRLKCDVYSLMNEVAYWSTVRDDANPDRSDFFCSTLKSVATEFETLDSLSFVDASSLLDRVQDAFEQLWTQQAFEPYPEARMLNLLQVVENEIASLLVGRLRSAKFWSESYVSVRDRLRPAITLCDQWRDACATLTGVYWKKWVTRKWQGDAYSCPHLQKLTDRLKQVLSLCAGKQILCTLVDQHTISEIDRLWQLPAEFNALYCNAHSDDRWKKQAEKIERKFGTLTREMMAEMKLLAPHSDSPSLHETLQRFLKYKDLLCIPLVKHEIIAERETLLFRITERLKLNQESFRRKTGSWAVFPETELSDTTVLIARTKQEEMQISELVDTVSELVDDLPGYIDFQEKCSAFRDELKTYRDDMYQRWCQDTMRAMDDAKNPLNLKRSCRVMELDHKSGMLRVNYSDGLVRLAKDVRQLLALGYKIPQRVQTCAQNAQKFMKYALIMKQVAHFYNNAEAEILPCLQAMMLSTAYAFEGVISGLKSSRSENGSPISVTWERSEDLENYLAKLKLAAERIANLSRMLLYYHQQIGEKMNFLKETSLLGHQLIWKETLNQVREIFDEAERLGVSAEDMKPWKIHWDMELVKVLEHQYQLGIEKLNETLPTLQAELRLVQKWVKLCPSEEELRAKYEKEMKRFISIPFNFKGFLHTVPSEKSIFARMVEQNSSRTEEAYKRLNDLFEQVGNFLKQFKDLGIIGELNLEDVIATRFRESNDWEVSFREIKTRGKAVEKIPRSITVGTVVINTEPLKIAAESRLQEAYEVLLSTLRSSCLKHCRQANEVLSEAVESLCERPKGSAEIAIAQNVQLNFPKKRAEIDAMVTKLEAEHELYKNVSGKGVQEMNQTRQLLQRFNSASALHQKTMEAQSELLKRNLSSRVQAHKEAVEKFAAKWYQFKPACDEAENLNEAKASGIANSLSQRRCELNEILNEAEQLRREADSLGIDKPTFGTLDEVERSLVSSEAVWLPYHQFISTLNEFGSEEWVVFRTKLHVLADFLHTWREKLKGLPVNVVTTRLRASVSKYLTLLPHLKLCIGEHFDSDHWVEFCRLLKLPADVKYDKLMFQMLLSSSDSIIGAASQLKKLNSAAQNEVSVRETIAELDTWAATCTFQLTSPDNRKHQYPHLIVNWNDVVNQVQDKQALLESVKKSSLDKLKFDKRTFWQENLVDLNERINLLQEIQRRWVYLEPIFSKGVLPKDWSRFQRVDQYFRSIMAKLAEDSRVATLRLPDVSKIQFSHMRDQLLECQKALNHYLEEKRCQFPRFYFVGDDDLLAILGQADQPDVIKAHIQKLFPSVSTVHLSPSSKSLTAIVSADGEVVQLRRAVEIIENNLDWLKTLEESIRSTLKDLLQAALSAINKAIPLDPSKYPCQILCLAERIRFTDLCEKAVKSKTLNELLGKLKAQISTYASTQPESTVLRTKLKALTLDAVHAVGVLEELVAHDVTSVGCWHWQKQLKFYVEADGEVVVKQLDASFSYSFEYTGQVAKLVQTPLTNRCFLTFTQAMKLGLCANPYGPTGTGKTETVKALGSLLGRTVLVFNCDKSADVQSMARMFAGLVQCGAWGCFDEFNRLEESVMSVIAMHIEVIQRALKSGSGHCKLLERQVPLNGNSAIFITLNPAGKQYGGRQKLPDNLKLLFRPVAMPAADDKIIAETLLLAEGFIHARSIGAKLVCLFKMFRDMLSEQRHYDWGLRTLKTVIQNSGDFRRAVKSTATHQLSAEQKEDSFVLMALRLNCSPKLTREDGQLFEALLQQAFINMQPTCLPNERLSSAIESAFSEMGFFPTDAQKIKVQELYEQLQQRTGVIVLGQSGSGKTTVWKILVQALCQLKRAVKAYHFNPNALAKGQLLGYVNPDTREWCDGLIPHLCRKGASEHTEVWSFIVCDGEIEPEWIEALNSVFDDNKLLTLTSGERIQIGSNVNFIFECNSLHSASPATVSRMGFVYLGTETVGVEAQLNRFVNTQPEDVRELLNSWLRDYFECCLTLLAEVNNSPIERSEYGKIVNGMSLLNGVRKKRSFLLRLCRGFGGSLERRPKEEFTVKLFKIVGEGLPDPSQPTNITYDAANDAYVTFDCYIEESLITNVIEFTDVPLARIVTISEAQEILNVLMQDTCRPFILSGPTGCGKSSLVRLCVQTIPACQLCPVDCSEELTVAHLLEKLRQYTTQSSSLHGRTLRPKDCDKLVLYVKRLNACKFRGRGTSAVISFLRQLVACGGFYDDSFEWVTLQNVQLVCSINSFSDDETRNCLTRFVSMVPTFWISYPSEAELQLICTTFLKPVLRSLSAAKLAEGIDAITSSFSRVMVSLYSKVLNTFYVDNCINYAFTPVDLICWAMGLLGYATHTGTRNELVDIWRYEGCCIFEDRLVSCEEKKRFKSIFNEILNREKLTVMDGADSDGSPYYVSFGDGNDLKLRGEQTSSRLCRIENDAFNTILERAIATFKYEVYDLNIVVIDELLKLIARMDRAIHSLCRNSIVLVGPSGLGRRTAVELLIYILQLRVVRLTMTPGYDYKHYKSNLKQVIQTACIANEPLVLLVEDYQLLSAQFYDPICSLLKCGEVPGLFKREEIEPLLNQLREQAFQDSYPDTLYSYFTHRVKCNLRIVLVLDVADSSLVSISRRYAACFNESTVISFDTWSSSSMLKVAQFVLSVSAGEDMANTPDMGGATSLPETARMVYFAVAEQSAVPRRYMAFLNQIRKLELQKATAMHKRLSVLQSGVSKLSEARSLTEKLKSAAVQNSNLLTKKQAEADAMLEDITSSITTANSQKSNMEALKRKSEEESQLLEEQRKAIDAKLSKIEPLIKQAKDDVQSIRADSLSEIRSLRAPPETIRDILEAVLLFMGIYDCSWASMRTFLSKSAVKEEIINFDAHRITPQSLEKVSDLVRRKMNSFEPSNAKRASAAAAPLAAWVIANMKYAEMLSRIAPLEQKRQKLQKSLRQMERQIDSIRSGLQSADETASRLRTKFQTLTLEASEIRLKLDDENKTLLAAETLTTKLASQYEQWKLQLTIIREELENLPRLAILASVHLHFMVGQSESTRRKVMKSLQDVLPTEGFNFFQFMGSEVEHLNLKREGLPDEDRAVESALAILNGCQVALVIDPSRQLMSWLVKHSEKTSAVEVVSQKNTTSYVTQLELSIRFGKTLILFDITYIDSMLHTILRDQFFCQRSGSRRMMKVGEKVIDCHEDFRLFLCTDQSFLALLSCTESLLIKVDFSLVESGLTSQLLSLTVKEMNPDLEKRRTEVLEEYEVMRVRLESTEEAILSQLASLKGNILEDAELLETLTAAKESSAKIEESLKESSLLRSKVEAERIVFLPLAKLACSIYFVIAELHTLCETYHYDLSFFVKLYSSVISKLKKSSIDELWMKQLKSSLIWRVIDTIGWSIFQKEHMAFVFRLVLSVFPEHFRPNEWLCFLRISEAGGLSLKTEDVPEWIDTASRQGVVVLKSCLPELYDNLDLSNRSLWKRFMETVACEEELPTNLKSKTTLFQQLLVVATLRQDRLLSAMNRFLNNCIGRESWRPAMSQLSQLLPESTCNEPILVIATFGADPSLEIEELAIATVGASNYVQVAMGHEECSSSISLIRECAANGKWLCLKNMHLVANWIPSMEAELGLLTAKDSFRLWLITERSVNFQPSFLRKCLKYVYEAPSGLKQNLLQTWSSQEASVLAQLPALSARAFFTLSLLHAICQERRTYIPQGWCKFYEFTYGDFKTGLDIVTTWLSRKSEESWRFVREILENVIYGCRMEDGADCIVLRLFLAQLFNKNLASSSPPPLLGKLALPLSNVHEEYEKVIWRISEKESIELMGLPANIQRSWELHEGKLQVEKINRLHLSGNGKTRMDPKSMCIALKPLLHLWKQLNQGRQLPKLCSPVDSSDRNRWSPIDSFASKEHSFAVHLACVVHADLTVIHKALQSTSAYRSADSKRTILQLFNNETPDEWRALWDGPSQPASFLKVMACKVLDIHEWMEKGWRSSLLAADPINISMFFRPAAFLSSFRQQSALKQNVEMDALKFRLKWSAEPPTSLCCRLSGLRIEGATFDGRMLTEVNSSSLAVSQVPVAFAAWLPLPPTRTEVTPAVSVPVYCDERRNSVLTYLDLPCSGEPTKWLLAKVALFP